MSCLSPLASAVSSNLSHGFRPHSAEFEELVDRMQGWSASLECLGFPERLRYITTINHWYDSISNRVSADELVELRLVRSLWAKRIAVRLVETVPSLALQELKHAIDLLTSVRTLLGRDAVVALLRRQRSIGDISSKAAMASLLVEHALPEEARSALQELGDCPKLLHRLGPQRISKFRPSRKSGRFDPTLWLNDESMSQLEFVEGDPDRIRVRGLELHSGDIGIVELNHPGDGLLESFLERPGLAPHAMLYVTRRIKDQTSSRVLTSRPSSKFMKVVGGASRSRRPFTRNFLGTQNGFARSLAART